MVISDKMCTPLWAKKEERAGRFYWLSLVTHLEDTMNVSRWLWNNWLSDRQREFCINSINPSNEETASDLAAFLGAVHDIGKATPAFQTQKGFSNSPDLDVMLLEKLERAGFSGIADLTLTGSRKSHHTVAGEYLLSQFQVKDDIGSIIGGHHGKPADERFEIEDQSAYVENLFQNEDKTSEIYKKWSHVQKVIYNWALEAARFENADQLPEISKPGQVIYSGLLIMADWIASNAEYFPLIPIDSEYNPDCATRYKNGISAWYKSLPLQIQSYPQADELFNYRFGFQPRNFQKIVCETVGHIQEPGIVILEAPMGLGKTEAALAAAEEIASKTGSSGLFFGLPTQATSNSMFERVHQWLENLTDSYDEKQSLRLQHGKAALNEEMNRLQNASSVDLDGENGSNVYVNQWFSGRKKASLDDFVVGTVDGFLLTALKQKHLALRHLGFSKKVIIIDEVHAYDTYMQQYLEEALRWMGAYGAPVILVSATLPLEKRKELIAAYLKGKGVKGRDIIFPEILTGCHYPLISYTDGMTVKAQASFEPVKDKIVYIKKISEDGLLDKVTELLEGNGVIGIIVNTVSKAQKLGKICKEHFGNDTVDILHSAIIATDRVRKENTLMRMIGKGGDRPKRKIIIGTQVIEQSLDIDFDVLITDLCPVDLLIQRIGRLHRHEIQRPERNREPVVYVMGTSTQLEFEKGTERIYAKYYLIRTQYFLPDEIRIPTDIPILIDQVYGSEKLELQGEQVNTYQASGKQMELDKQNKQNKALTYRIDAPHIRIKPDKYNLIGWLENPDFSRSDETATAQVRDIADTIEVIAVKQTGNGYGTFDNEEDISARIDEPGISRELTKQTIRLPLFATRKKGISATIEFLEKYNLKCLPDWQDQPWLKGSLGIVFDENGRFDMNGIILKYDNEYGLREEKNDGKV